MDLEVRVQAKPSAQRYEPAFFLYSVPSMRVHESGMRWLAARASRHAEAKQRSDAYAIAYWLTYCLAADVDYREASVDDLVDYKTALANITSAQTREKLKDGTIRIRLKAAIEFYVHGQMDGWYQLGASEDKQALQSDQGRQSIAITEECHSLLPRKQMPDANIRPFTPAELKELFSALSAESKAPELRIRDRLIAEWMCYVGLRISETVGKKAWNGLSKSRVMRMRPNAEAPTDHSPMEVVGKFGTKRTVAVPNWLVIRTQDYITTERSRECERATHESDALFVNSSKSPTHELGSPISIRRYEAILERACRDAGLDERGTYGEAESRTHLQKKARNSPHDLRHTYAVMTYFAERHLGNPDPWKPIQAQLGHRHMSTTVDTYLRHVSIFSQWGTDLRNQSMRQLAGLGHA